MYFSGRIFALQRLDLDCERSWFRSPASPFFSLSTFFPPRFESVTNFISYFCANLERLDVFYQDKAKPRRAEPDTRGARIKMVNDEID